MRMHTTAHTLGFGIFQAYYGVSRRLKKIFSDNGIEEMGPTELGILLLLAERDGRRMTEIAELLNVQKSTLTGVVDRMVRDGHVERRPDETDRRAHRIYLTLDARYRAKSVSVLVEKTYAELSAGLAPEEIETAAKALDVINENCTRLNQSSG